MRYLLVLLTLFLTACGGGDSESPPSQTQKQMHPGIQVQDIVQDYVSGQSLTPIVEGTLGNITYQLADKADIDVIKVSVDQRHVTILNAGTAELIATDSGNSQFKPVSQRFRVIVNKAQRSQSLLINDISLVFEAGASITPSVSGALGKISYRLSEGQPAGVVSIDAQGSIKIQGSGEVMLTVTDDGGRNYLVDESQFKVNISPATTAYANFQNISNKPLIFGGRLTPVYTGTPTQEIRYSLVEGANANVIQVHPSTGEMSILGAGNTQVEVTQIAPEGHTQVPQQRFNVQINKAKNLALSASDHVVTYDADNSGELKVSGSQGKLHFALKQGAAEEVITITDAELGLFTFEGLGETQVQITDAGNENYLSETRVIRVKVNPMPADSLNALDISTRYQINQNITPQIIGQHGNLSYQLTTNSPTDVITLDEQNGLITVLKPGSVDILVNDDGGEFWTPQQRQFNITIDKQDNTLFDVENSRIDYAENQLFIPKPLNQKGKVNYQVENGGDNVLSQANDTRAITIVGAGRAWITATDTGNEFYHSATSRFYVDVAPLNGTLKISSVRSQYVANKIINIPLSGAIGELSQQFSSGQDDVVRVNLAERTLEVLNAGSAVYIITDSGDAGHVSQKAELAVVIDKALENTKLSLSEPLITSVYAQDATIASPSILGQARDSRISFYNDLASQKIVSVKDDTGELTIRNAGLAKVTVVEESRNFERTMRDFNVNISKAKHTGLILNDITQSVVFYPGRSVSPPELDNHFGNLSYQFTYPVSIEYAELQDSGDIILHNYPRSRENDYLDITVTDDGGNNYQGSSLTYKLFLKTIEPGLGEEANLSFDGTTLQVASPVNVAAGDVSYFTVTGGRGDAVSKDGNDELKDGYTNIIAQLCTDPENYQGCTFVTLRLQKSSQCSDGSKIAYSISSQSIYTCPGMTQPESSEVTVSLNNEDPFNNLFVKPGHYKSIRPIVVTHFAKPYRSGDVIEAGDIQARAWWLINLDITKP